MAQQNTNPNPQTANQQQPQPTQAQPTQLVTNVHKHEHHHHIDNSGIGWGAMLVAGAVGFLFGQFLADGNQTQPAPTKHFWQ